MFRQNDTTAELDVGKKDLDLGEKKRRGFQCSSTLEKITEGDGADSPERYGDGEWNVRIMGALWPQSLKQEKTTSLQMTPFYDQVAQKCFISAKYCIFILKMGNCGWTTFLWV